jgi:23S rRNA (cytosine1962-C5)-methyltransferase
MIKDNSMFEALIPRFPDYELIDSGDFEKLERFGRYVVRRPEPQAIWRRSLTEQEWRRLADASFLRDGRSEERGEWRLRSGMPSRWTVDYAYDGMRLRMRLGLTSFKHVGLFPEQAANWNFIYDNCVRMRAEERTPKVLNLFAYTGGATLAARAAGADTTHVDSVKQVVTWARENMEQSGLEGVRWIVEDALKFVQREVRLGEVDENRVARLVRHRREIERHQRERAGQQHAVDRRRDHRPPSRGFIIGIVVIHWFPN